MWKDIVKTVAPLIGTAVGGPLGGMATKMITDVLGLDNDAPEKDIASAMQKASPDQLLLLSQADHDFKARMKELNITEQQLVYADIDSARKREMALGDKTPTVLALLITFGFFGMLAALLYIDIPEASKSIIYIMVGSLGTAWIQAVSYYFGSSKGSDKKTNLLTGGKK